VVTGEVANSPIIRGTSVKLPRACEISSSNACLSESLPQIVSPQAVAVNSPYDRVRIINIL
jgi:hypothetical protein